MWIAYFFIIYSIFAGAFLFLVIFGQNPVFSGTAVEKAALFVTGGCCDVLLHGIEALCGRGAARRADACLEYMCFSRHPLLAGIYLVMVALIYYLYSIRVFGILPSTVTPEWHKYSGTASTALCVILWYIVCYSDPGTITDKNHEQWIARDPPGDSLYGLSGWVNNCIGAANLRWFLAFLLSNVVMMWYGAALAAGAVWGRLADIGYLDREFRLPRTGKVIVFRYRPWYTFKLGLRIYPTAIALSIFLLISGFVLLGFFGFHAWGASIGVTKHDRLKQARANKARLEEKGQATSERSPKVAPVKVSYSRGFWQNWLEVLAPSCIVAAGTGPGATSTPDVDVSKSD